VQAEREGEHGQDMGQGLRGQLPQVSGPQILLLQAGELIGYLHLMHSA